MKNGGAASWKYRIMIIAGIILMALEVYGVVDDLLITKNGLPSKQTQLLGYCLPGIIGLALFFSGMEKEKQRKQ